MKELTPVQLLNAKVTGHFWGTIGLILALIIMIYRGIWYFSIFILAMTWLQWHEYRGAKQKYKAIVKLMEAQ